MEYEWDRTKSDANIEQGRLAFEAVNEFEWDTAHIEPSHRFSEIRFVATGYIGTHLHVLVFSFRGENVRVISLRPASRSERRDYAES